MIRRTAVAVALAPAVVVGLAGAAGAGHDGSNCAVYDDENNLYTTLGSAHTEAECSSGAAGTPYPFNYVWTPAPPPTTTTLPPTTTTTVPPTTTTVPATTTTTAPAPTTTTTPPLEGIELVAAEAEGAETAFRGFVATTAVPILFGLLVLGLGIALAVRYVRRGARGA